MRCALTTIRLSAAWRNTSVRRATGKRSEAITSASTCPGPTEGSWSTSPTSSRPAWAGMARVSAFMSGTSTIKVSSTTSRSQTSGLSSVREKPPCLGSISRYTTLLRAVELWGAVRADGPGRLAGDEELPPVNGLAVCRKQDLSQQPTCADGAPLWVKMVALRAGLAEPLDGDRVE